MSSFRRASTADTGTRPGLHGQTLVSMGLVDFDRLLAGGLPLASVLLLLEDACSGQHLNIMRYFMAEGLACRQRVMWLTACPPPGGPGAFLPAEASPGQSGRPAADEAGKEQPELRIAWQYKKYIRDDEPGPSGRAATSGARPASGSGSGASRPGAALAAGVGREWCHSYDLTKPAGEAALQGGLLEVHECSGAGAYSSADERTAAFLSSLQAPEQPVAGPGPGSAAAAALAAAAGRRADSVGRLVVESAGSLAWGEGDGEEAERALLRLLCNVRQRVQRSRCAALVTVPAGLLSPGCAARLPHLADTVLALDPLADDSQLHRLLPDPASAVALLSVRKLCSTGMLGPRLPDGQLHVLRHRRRRLGLSAVEVDPDAEERAAEAVARAVEAYAAGGSGGGVGKPGGVEGNGGGAGKAGKAGKGAAALLCGGPPSSNKALDF